jgi:hypothetical protein
MRRGAHVGILLWAAVSHGRLLDALVARVDQSVITWSQVVEELAIRRLAGESDQPLGPRAATDVLVRRRLLVADARKMRLVAPPSEVEAEVKAEVKALAGPAGNASAFEAALRKLGLSKEDLNRRATEIVLMRRYLALRRDMTYVPESEVRSFYAGQVDVLGGRPLAEVRDEVRSVLAQRKYQQQLDEWIVRQVAEGRVRVMEPAGGWPAVPAGP